MKELFVDLEALLKDNWELVKEKMKRFPLLSPASLKE